MNSFITTATLKINAAKHILEQINECEGLIVNYELELTEADLENWQTKETSKQLTDTTEKKQALVKHFNEHFDLDYNIDLHQSLAYYKQWLWIINNCQNQDWLSSMWLNEDEGIALADETKLKADALKKSMISEYGISTEQLEEAAQ